MTAIRYLISDSHLGHVRIREYEPCRQAWGADVLAMTETMINAWNEVVKPEDTVLHLGDFMLGPKTAWADYRRRLNGKIILVRGNHDPSKDSKHWALLEPLEVYSSYAFTLHTPDSALRVICRHDPHEFTLEEFERADILAHGHLHSGKHREDTPEYLRSKCVCLSVERLPTMPAPMPLSELVNLFRSQHAEP